jgi:hypothetical protein
VALAVPGTGPLSSTVAVTPGRGPGRH